MMKSTENLILIGAGFINTKCAGVLLYHSLKKKSATIEEVNKSNIVCRLKDAIKEKYKKIFLIGTSIEDRNIVAVAGKLYKNKTEIIRFSAYKDIDDDYKKELDQYIELEFKNDQTEGDNNSFYIVKDYISERSDYFDPGNDFFPKIQNIYQLGKFGAIKDLTDKKAKAEAENSLKMLEAASSLVRRFDDMKGFQKIIKKVSKSEFDKEIIEEYVKYGSRELVGKSKKTKKLKNDIKTIAKNVNCSVMIYGDSGTGKETIAYQIHAQTENRKEQKFVAFNCADLTPSLIENKLFGYKKGAFTGAIENKDGLFKKANKGTLFLDEIAELSLELQAGLLRVLQERRFYPVGSTEEIEVDIRVIGATNKDIFKLMEEGKFREDLYFRLATVEIKSLSLKDNKEDIGLIASRYAYSAGFIGNGIYNLSDEQIESLKNYDWPGNVRQLQNVIDRAKIFGEKNFDKLIKEQKEHFKPKFEKISEEDVERLENKDDILHFFAKRIRKNSNTDKEACDKMGVALNSFKKYLKNE